MVRLWPGNRKPDFSKTVRASNRFLATIAIAAGIGLTQTLPMLGSSSELYGAGSLNELVELRDRLVETLESPSESGNVRQFIPIFANRPPEPRQDVLEKLRAVELQILIERRANDSWKQGISLATQAVDVGKASEISWETREQMALLWERAIANLQEIPEESFLKRQAAEKIGQYQDNLDRLKLDLQNVQAEILEQIRRDSGLSGQATISVCNFNRHCASLRGDKPPASPASLIKVPVAIALLHKADLDQVSFDESVYVEGGNFTEDASDIRARKSYPLKILMGQMIDHSSNIATNQLIDYLGHDYINSFLEGQGFKETRVRFKLMGDRIMPFRPGKGRNRLTSDELTEMMIKIYNYEYPDSELLIEALSQQYDREIGYMALEGLNAEWLGEKTGQNSKMIGTTVAASIDGERYVITITDNYSGHIPQIRRAIAGIVDHVIRNGHI